MALVLYENYCYADSASVASAVQSRLFIEGFGAIVSASSVDDTHIQITYINQSTAIPQNLTFTLISCSQLGFNQSYSGLTIGDSVELSGLILLVLVAAYWIRPVIKAL